MEMILRQTYVYSWKHRSQNRSAKRVEPNEQQNKVSNPSIPPHLFLFLPESKLTKFLPGLVELLHLLLQLLQGGVDFEPCAAHGIRRPDRPRKWFGR